MVERRKTVGLAGFFLLVELFGFELVVADHTPVVACRIHREAWRERPIHADDHGVLPGTAIPGEMIALHKVDHLPKASVRIYRFIAAILLLSQPLNCFHDRRPVIFCNVGDIVVRVLEWSVAAHHQGCVAADVDVQKH
jgi:hypothetical protein